MALLAVRVIERATDERAEIVTIGSRFAVGLAKKVHDATVIEPW
jgi:hypothetical protein